MSGDAASAPSSVLYENNKSYDNQQTNLEKSGDVEHKKTYKIELIWPVVIIIILLHAGALYGIYLVFTSAKVATTLFAFFLYQFSLMGVTAGVHRLWSHRSYKAKWPLRVMLMIMHTTAYQYTIIRWSRDHRGHHKYVDTDADPYNAKRSIFFSHMGWTMVRKHPDVIDKGKLLDLTDLYNDPIVKFQEDNFLVLMLLCCFVFPTLIPVYFWSETLKNAFVISTLLRWVVASHITSLVNSAAHIWGTKPFDKNFTPVQNLSVAILTSGEGWHNYHHAFSWDYKAAELGGYEFNFTTAFIDFMAWIGLAYDLKTVSQDLIKQRALRTGDGSHKLWGWDDKHMEKEDREATIITKKDS